MCLREDLQAPDGEKPLTEAAIQGADALTAPLQDEGKQQHGRNAAYGKAAAHVRHLVPLSSIIVAYSTAFVGCDGRELGHLRVFRQRQFRHTCPIPDGAVHAPAVAYGA